nr:unnamed protein product [Callosobruchus chinensis]
MSRSHNLVKIVPCGILELNLEQGLAVSQRFLVTIYNSEISYLCLKG